MTGDSTAPTGADLPARPRDAVGVVVVHPSSVRRRLLRGVIEGDRRLAVVGEARTPEEAAGLVERLRPAVVLLDLGTPPEAGIAAVERIMATVPTPIVVASASADPDDAGALSAIAAGAVDVVPALDDAAYVDGHAAADELRQRLRVASRVRVITHPRARLRRGGAEPAPAPAPVAPPVRRPRDRDIELVAVGVSTGGPQALSVLLGQLPADLPQAVVVVQHMADGFLQGLADWLDAQCALPVVLGSHGKRLQPGTVTIAPGRTNLLVHERLRVTCEPPLPTQFHIPGIDATFTSVAANLGPAAVGVILTGMGRDGAEGLRAMRDRGAVTIGQDEASCAVYGMPGAAKAIGAVEYERPLAEIAPLLLSLLGASNPTGDGPAPPAPASAPADAVPATVGAHAVAAPPRRAPTVRPPAPLRSRGSGL